MQILAYNNIYDKNEGQAAKNFYLTKVQASYLTGQMRLGVPLKFCEFLGFMRMG